MKKTVEVMRNFPSDSFSKKEKKEALGDFLSPASKDYNRVSKNDLYNALIYLYPMIDFGVDYGKDHCCMNCKHMYYGNDNDCSPLLCAVVPYESYVAEDECCEKWEDQI